VVIRFWIVTMILALTGLSVLGMNRLLLRDEAAGSSALPRLRPDAAVVLARG